MFIILGGTADVVIDGKTIVTLSGQTLVGEIEFLDGRPASADVVLIEDTDLVQLDNTALLTVFDEQPRIGYMVMHGLAKLDAQRLRTANKR